MYVVLIWREHIKKQNHLHSGRSQASRFIIDAFQNLYKPKRKPWTIKMTAIDGIALYTRQIGQGLMFSLFSLIRDTFRESGHKEGISFIFYSPHIRIRSQNQYNTVSNFIMSPSGKGFRHSALVSFSFYPCSYHRFLIVQRRFLSLLYQWLQRFIGKEVSVYWKQFRLGTVIPSRRWKAGKKLNCL